MKLGNLFYGDTITITQSPHSINQGYCAFDGYGSGSKKLKLRVPEGYPYWTVQDVKGVGKGRFFNLVSSNGRFYIQMVHCRPYKVGRVYPGEDLGEIVPYLNDEGKREDHLHWAPVADKKWRWFTDYIDREIKLRWGWPGESRWDDYSTYPVSLELPGTIATQPPVDSCANLKIEIKNLKAELLVEQAKSAQLRQEVIVLERAIDGLEESLEIQVELVKKKESEISQLIIRNESALKEVGKLKGENEVLARKNNELRSSNAKLGEDKAQLLKDKRALQKELNECQKGNNILDRIISWIKSKRR